MKVQVCGVGLFLGLGFLFGACSTASVRVLPGADGTHRAVVRDRKQEGA